MWKWLRKRKKKKLLHKVNLPTKLTKQTKNLKFLFLIVLKNSYCSLFFVHLCWDIFFLCFTIIIMDRFYPIYISLTKEVSNDVKWWLWSSLLWSCLTGSLKLLLKYENDERKYNNKFWTQEYWVTVYYYYYKCWINTKLSFWLLLKCNGCVCINVNEWMNICKWNLVSELNFTHTFTYKQTQTSI